MENMLTTYNNAYMFDTRFEPESIALCRFRLPGTKYNIKLNVTACVYYRKSANRVDLVNSQTENAYSTKTDTVHEIKLDIPNFPVDKVTRSYIIIAIDNNASDYNKIFIEDTTVTTIQRSTKIGQTVIQQPPMQLQLGPLIVRSRIVGNKKSDPNIHSIRNSNNMLSYGPKLAIASIVRDEESNGNLGKFLDCCRELEQYQKNIIYIFIEGDSSDKTYDTLKTWIENRDGSILEKIDMLYSPFINDRNNIRTTYFAQLRNRIIEIILSIPDIHEILMIDASYVWKGDLITSLREVNTDIVAPMNVIHSDSLSENKENYKFYDVWVFRKNGKEFRWDYPYVEGMILDKPSEVDSVGGGYLVKRKVLELGARYNGDTDSEQIGFCQSARNLGFDIKIHPKVYLMKLTRIP